MAHKRPRVRFDYRKELDEIQEGHEEQSFLYGQKGGVASHITDMKDEDDTEISYFFDSDYES